MNSDHIHSGLLWMSTGGLEDSLYSAKVILILMAHHILMEIHVTRNGCCPNWVTISSFIGVQIIYIYICVNIAFNCSKSENIKQKKCLIRCLAYDNGSVWYDGNVIKCRPNAPVH